MKIIFFEVPKEEQNIFLGFLKDLDVSFFEEKLEEENVHLAEGADIISVFINSKVSKGVIAKIPSLKLITTRSTGFDHIDKEYSKEKGILVSNVPAYGSKTVAEFAFALILALSRKIFEEIGRAHV